MPGVMYLISLVILPMIANPLISVRRPGIRLDGGRTKLNEANSTREGRIYSPVPLPDSQSLVPYLQNVKEKHK